MMKKLISTIWCLGLLAGCGGGGGGSTATTGQGGGQTPVPPASQCSVAAENEALLGYLQDDYYWYQDIPQGLDAASFASPQDLLAAAKVAQDRFSFVISTAEFDAIFTNANFVGMGFSNRVASNGQTLEIRYVFDNGAAFEAGMARGDNITAINGTAVSELVSQVNAGQTTWAAIFGQSVAGNEVTLTYSKPSGESLTKVFVKSVIDTNTVLASQVIPTLDKQVGYMVFDQFISRSEADLNTAFNQLSAANVDELILDLRYNGGGFVHVANQLSTQIAGTNVSGQTFTGLVYNDKNTARNTSQTFALGEGVEQLNLDRVIVLTTAQTCSASELVINGLSPFIDVVTIGDTTCGKPVGMNPVQICEDTIFAINFETVNGLGVGGYFNGIATECFAQDNIVADWGSIEDPLLREGLFYIDNGSCFTANRAPLALEQSPANLNDPIDFRLGPRATQNIR